MQIRSGLSPTTDHLAELAATISQLMHTEGRRWRPLEDTATDYDEIEAEFGEDVADAVVLLTKNNMLPIRDAPRIIHRTLNVELSFIDMKERTFEDAIQQ